MHMNITQLVAYDLATFMLKPVVDPTQMRSFAGMNDSKMVAARVRGKPAAAKVMRRPTAKSGNDDPAVIGDATEPLTC